MQPITDKELDEYLDSLSHDELLKLRRKYHSFIRRLERIATESEGDRLLRLYREGIPWPR